MDKLSLPLLIGAASFNLIVIIAGTLAARTVSSRKRLEKKGYPEPYILVQQRIARRFGLEFAVFMVVFQILLLLVLPLKEGQEPFSFYMFSVVIPTMILALPFALIRTAKFNGEYKRLAEEHKYELAVDFGFSLLKRMYRLGLEIPASLLILAYLLLFHSWEESAVIVLYVMLLWFFAGTVFFSRYGILPTMKDQYALMGKMFIIYQSLLVFLLLIPQGLSNWSGLGAAGQLMFCVLAAGLVGKSFFYLRVYPGFINELEGR